jgi:putative tryptophan/tyrosine transport system substrate-binding protein
MRLIELAVILSLALAPLAVEAQEHGKVYRVGRLSVSAVGSASTEALKRGLRELGWTVDQNLLIEIRSAAGDANRLPALAAELVRMKVDVIVAVGSDSVDAAFRTTKDIPIIMAVGSDPEKRGWIKSLARPGGNVTGLIGFLPEMGGKRIELVKDLLPKARRVGVMTDLAPGNRSEFEHLEAAGRTLRLEIRQILVKSAEDLDAAFTLLRKTPVDALYVQSSARVLDGLRSRIAAFGISARLPVIGALPSLAESGFLLAYGTSSEGWSHRSAYFVDKILRGAQPADLPIEQPTKFELIINLKTAKALGLTIPQTLLLRADQVIE